MAKGRRRLMELSDVLDVILEVRDARAPMLTRSPVSELFPESLSVWYILSKADLADSGVTSGWLSSFRDSGRRAWALDLRVDVPASLKKSLASLAPISSSAGRNYRETRVAVVGTPNVGKSTLLNRLVGRRAAVVGGVPGVTKGVAWFKGQGFVVADSPGILDPRAEAGVHRMMSWISSTKGRVIGSWDDLARECVDFMARRGILAGALSSYGVDHDGDAADVLERVGRRLGKLRPGGGVDLEASGRAFIDALSSGRLGRFSLESPEAPALAGKAP
jgi:ribosome biogenesis GTPase A